jgi:predicted anti-sigma-YlaC factor YlaD
VATDPDCDSGVSVEGTVLLVEDVAEDVSLEVVDAAVDATVVEGATVVIGAFVVIAGDFVSGVDKVEIVLIVLTTPDSFFLVNAYF